MSARRSHLVTSLRSWASHARVRSTTHRCRPSLVEVSTPLRAIRGAMDRARHSPRHRRPSQALSAWSLPGRLRGRPRCPDRAPGTASSVGAGAMLSWRFAPVRVRPSGVPRRSVTQCRLVPGRPRSVGFGPISAPPSCPDGGSVQRGTRPVQLARPVEASEEHPVQPVPHLRVLPVPQASPAGQARAAEHLARRHLPWQARAQREHDPTQGIAVRHPRAAFGFAGSPGRSGSTTSHISSGTRSCPMTPDSTKRRSASSGAVSLCSFAPQHSPIKAQGGRKLQQGRMAV